jgi:hypothetical protein
MASPAAQIRIKRNQNKESKSRGIAAKMHPANGGAALRQRETWGMAKPKNATTLRAAHQSDRMIKNLEASRGKT